MTCCICCEQTGQDLFPILLRGLAEASMACLWVVASAQLTCLPLAAGKGVGAVMGRACFLYGQLRGLAAAAMGSLVIGAGTQLSCLQLASARAAGTLKGRAPSPCSQLKGLATGTKCVGLNVLLSRA